MAEYRGAMLRRALSHSALCFLPESSLRNRSATRGTRSGVWLQHYRFGVGRPCRVFFNAAWLPAPTIISDAFLSAVGVVAAVAANSHLIAERGYGEDLVWVKPISESPQHAPDNQPVVFTQCFEWIHLTLAPFETVIV